MKYHQTVQGDEIRNFYTSKGQPETKQYNITVHFWFSKVVLGISHILNLIFKITFSVLTQFPCQCNLPQDMHRILP